MKAVVYEGPRAVSVKDVADARIERPTDVLVKITTTNNLTTPDDPRMAGAAHGFADIGPYDVRQASSHRTTSDS
ncbi:hypothetical protein [Streptomyces sp. PSAA01]|uniref:hypothetical protein n=1 Tax=Streptomyces sp. PSAA01 TaxID=2912762 RepID=UPI001F16F85A|nr:hypothetical protein [Streptomyces sp. PSAA01]MCG0283748.1 hypothetical protein [Streptomyces sp. PSAA01]